MQVIKPKDPEGVFGDIALALIGGALPSSMDVVSMCAVLVSSSSVVSSTLCDPKGFHCRSGIGMPGTRLRFHRVSCTLSPAGC